MQKLILKSFILIKRVTYQPSLYMFDNEKNGNITLEPQNYMKYLGVLVDKKPYLEISH